MILLNFWYTAYTLYLFIMIVLTIFSIVAYYKNHFRKRGE